MPTSLGMDKRQSAWWGGAESERLSTAEDGALRRLHWFEQLGCDLSNALRALKDGIRRRDRRTEIRDPYATPMDIEKARAEAVSESYWAEPKK